MKKIIVFLILSIVFVLMTLISFQKMASIDIFVMWYAANKKDVVLLKKSIESFSDTLDENFMTEFVYYKAYFNTITENFTTSDIDNTIDDLKKIMQLKKLSQYQKKKTHALLAQIYFSKNQYSNAMDEYWSILQIDSRESGARSNYELALLSQEFVNKKKNFTAKDIIQSSNNKDNLEIPNSLFKVFKSTQDSLFKKEKDNSTGLPNY